MSRAKPPPPGFRGIDKETATGAPGGGPDPDGIQRSGCTGVIPCPTHDLGPLVASGGSAVEGPMSTDRVLTTTDVAEPLGRIAKALERIATSLEPAANVSRETSESDDGDWCHDLCTVGHHTYTPGCLCMPIGGYLACIGLRATMARSCSAERALTITGWDPTDPYNVRAHMTDTDRDTRVSIDHIDVLTDKTRGGEVWVPLGILADHPTLIAQARETQANQGAAK